jgi:hypothetical protein
MCRSRLQVAELHVQLALRCPLMSVSKALQSGALRQTAESEICAMLGTGRPPGKSRGGGRSSFWVMRARSAYLFVIALRLIPAFAGPRICTRRETA